MERERELVLVQGILLQVLHFYQGHQDVLGLRELHLAL